MATIDSKKLLPAGRPGGSIVESQKPLLVPVNNVLFKKDVKISQKLLKPADQEKESGGSLVVIKKKITKISDIIQSTYLIEQSESNRKRKEKERQKAEDREKQLETRKPTKVSEKNLAKISLPGKSILDTINRFLAFTLIGYLFDKYNQFLPKLVEFTKLITPVAQFIEAFGKNVVNRVIDFIDVGYQAYDKVRAEIKNIGGEGAQKTFDEFSKNLNLILNGAIGAAMLIASTAPRSPKGVSGAIGAGMGAGRGYGYTPEPLTPGVKPGTIEGRAITKAQRDAARSAEKATRRNAGAAIRRGIAGETTEQAAKQLASQGAKQSLKSLVAVPVIGSLIGFIIDTVVFREKPTRAAAGAVGSALGQGIGIFLAGSTTFGLGAGIGMFVGGFIGDMLGKTIYDSLTGFKPEPIPAKAQGGQVSGGQSKVAASRRIKTTPKRTRKTYIPQKTQPGKDIGGKQKIEQLYGKDEPGKRSALRALRKSSEDLKKMSSLNGVAGAMFGAGIDMSLGQKPDKKLATSLGNTFGSVIQAAVDAELDSSFNDISRTIAMANGGVVPSREIKGGMSIGEKIGKYISNAFSIALESSASKVLQNLNQEFNLKGGAPGTISSGGFDDGSPPGDFSGDVKAMKAFNYFKSQGYTDFQSAAIVGNLLQENRAMNPRLMNSIGMKGIAQWDANRWSNLEKFAANKKIDPYSFETQLQFIQHELRTGDGGLSASVFKGTKNLEEATVMFRKKYERPGEAEANDAARIKYAKGVLQSTKFEYVAPGKVSPVVTGRFGETRSTGSHGGSDLAVPAGTPLRAISDGKIVESDYESGWGNYTVFIDKSGIYHLYGHMSGRGRGKGNIKKGDIIGYVGMTGRTSGPHLHWETGTGWNGTITGAFDPLKRYSVNAPFNTQKESSKKTDKNKPSEIFNWDNQSSVAPSQQSREIASLQQTPSYSLVENNTILYQKEFVLT
jgi:murein DD-endopeptidase MepM/ murein hydrolase activator NlpD